MVSELEAILPLYQESISQWIEMYETPQESLSLADFDTINDTLMTSYLAVLQTKDKLNTFIESNSQALSISLSPYPSGNLNR